MIYRKVPIAIDFISRNNETLLKNNDSIHNRFYLYILNYFVNKIYLFLSYREFYCCLADCRNMVKYNKLHCIHTFWGFLMRKIRSWHAEVMKHIKISIKSFALSVKLICINL